MTSQTTNRHIVVKEHEPLRDLDATAQDDLKRFALANLDEDNQQRARPVLALRDGRLHARNHVGILETSNGTVVEILPKIDFATGEASEPDTRRVFLEMLRAYRSLRFADFDQTSINALRRFDMLSVFVRLFLEDLVRLTQRGLARHYQPVEDNLQCLRGRVQFPPHIRLNAANRTRFYVSFDEFTANRPVNRLIHTTIHRLRATAHPEHRQLLNQLRICFADVPLSERPDADWRRHRIDRSMRHYDTVMAWVGLFLFNQGLATFAGEHVNRALLFPMEQVFEDFVVDAFRRHQGHYSVRAQGPQQAFAQLEACNASANAIWPQRSVRLKPDIALMRGDKVHFILDAKWKKIGGTGSGQTHEIAQSDIYQLYSYGRKFGCRNVALIYPKTPQFRSPLRYQFEDAVGQPLTLWCFPFDVRQPRGSVKAITAELEYASAAPPKSWPQHGQIDVAPRASLT